MTAIGESRCSIRSPRKSSLRQTALHPKADIKLNLVKRAATDPKRTVAIPMRNGSIVAPIRSKPHVQRAQYEKRRQEATGDDSERAEGGEEVQERSDEV